MSDLTNSGRVAVITGASSGIGAATAVQRGYDAATVKPEEIADVIAFVLARPRHLAINEILLRPADQA
jgi:NADP-dependent 3-hydroxy acid dehydrogenase YdfG